MDSLFNYNILGQVTHSPTKEQANHCRKIGCFLLFISCKIYIKKKHLSWNSTKGMFKFLLSKFEMLSFGFLIFKFVSE